MSMIQRPERRNRSSPAGTVFERKNMRKIDILTFVTLDSVLQTSGGEGEDPSGGFDFVGWVRPSFGLNGAKGNLRSMKVSLPEVKLIG